MQGIEPGHGEQARGDLPEGRQISRDREGPVHEAGALSVLDKGRSMRQVCKVGIKMTSQILCILPDVSEICLEAVWKPGYVLKMFMYRSIEHPPLSLIEPLLRSFEERCR